MPDKLTQVVRCALADLIGLFYEGSLSDPAKMTGFLSEFPGAVLWRARHFVARIVARIVARTGMAEANGSPRDSVS